MICDYCNNLAEKLFDVLDTSDSYCEDCFDSQTVECESCNHHMSAGYANRVDGYIACPDCYSEATQCHNCDRHCSETFAVYILYNSRRQEVEYCENCYNDAAFFCNDCNCYFDSYYFDSNNIDGNTVCERCIENYTQCYECGDYDSGENGTNDDSGNYYCEYCAERHLFYCASCGDYFNDNDRNDHNHDIHDYSYNVLDSLDFLGKPANGIYFGVELEVEAGRDIEDAAENFADAFDGFAILKQDGSLDNGFEIVTAPATLEIHKAEWSARLTPDLISDVHSQHANCGLHIHVSRKPLSELTLAKLTAFLNLADNLPQVEKIAGRKCNRYSSAKKIEKLGKYKEEISDRYSILNLKKFATIEFRIFAGIVDTNHIFRCLEFAAASVEFAKQASLERLGFSDFVDFLVSCGRDMYPQLYKFYELASYKRNLQELGIVKKSI